MITALDHVALAVRDFKAGVAAYETLLGRRAQPTEPADGAVRAWFSLGGIALEIIAPTGAGAAGERVRQHLAERGEGLFLMAFAVSDAEAAGRRLARLGLATQPIGAAGALAADRAGTYGVPIVLTPSVKRPASPAIGRATAAVVGLDHLVIQTANPDRAVALYAGRLGLDFRLDRSNPDWGSRLLFFRCGSSVVEVSHWLDEAASDRPDRLYGLAWRVRDAEAAHARLADGGFGLSEVRKGRRPASRVFTLQDGLFGVPTLVLGVEPAAQPA
jgi:catechol 2,3-dioxygenase-like lactoylglutathione lyase family enzyme